MTQTPDRRADSTRRIPVEALVEVCATGGKLAPFEAESADVSGRGIRLKTAYLPDFGSTVVCRFDNGGQEVIAEGVVAWCQKEARGGEFGVKFTALDARSADVLKSLCGLDAAVATNESLEPARSARDEQGVVKGAKVKLHIEGLGAPMRARVDDGTGRRIAVGSTLEFLRMGRRLEMESLEDGTRREARIDGLDVSIDPATGVPRLVVLLKTDCQEDTPQPSVVDTVQAVAASGVAERGTAKWSSKSELPVELKKTARAEAQRESFTQEAIDAQVELMVGRMRRIAGSARRKAGEVSEQLGTRIVPAMGQAVHRLRGISSRGQESARRRTAPPPTPATATNKLRPQNRPAGESQTEVVSGRPWLMVPKAKRTAGAVVAVGLLATVIAVASRSPESKATSATEPQLAQKPNLAQVQPAAPGLSVGAAAQPVSGGVQTPGSLVAPVPLFGPTPMATLEPAPVATPAAEPPEVVAARELALAKASQAAALAGNAMPSEEPAAEANEEPATKPEDVPPWGKGRMREPTLYRIRLDEAGSALKGSTQAKGFTVIIPERKAMESPKGFVSRDPRFAKISAQNTASGVKLTWLFKDEVPAFRVRLRKSNVEILVSESSKGKKAE